MAKIRLGLLVQGINGSIGDLTFVATGGGGIVKRRGRPRAQPIAVALRQRSVFKDLLLKWGQLSAADQQAWRTIAARVQKSDALGRVRLMKGRELFLEVNGPFCRNLTPFILTPPSRATREGMQAVSFAITSSSAAMTITKSAAMPAGYLEAMGGRGFGSSAMQPRRWALVSLRTYTTSTTFSLSTTWPNVIGYPAVGERWFARFRCMANGGLWSPWVTFTGITAT